LQQVRLEIVSVKAVINEVYQLFHKLFHDYVTCSYVCD